MSRSTWKHRLAQLQRPLLGACAVLLLLSSLEHLTNPFRFLDGVMAYDLLSFRSARVVAMGLPAVSLMAGLALLSRMWRPGGVIVTAVLGLLFTTVQSTALIRDLAISCGCFDPFRSEQVSLSSLLFPLTLFFASVFSLVLGGFDDARFESKSAVVENV